MNSARRHRGNMIRIAAGVLAFGLTWGATAQLGGTPAIAADAGCAGQDPAAIVDGLVTVTCGDDSGPGSLRQAVTLANDSEEPVRIEIAASVPEIQLASSILAERWVHLSGQGSEHTVIRATAEYDERSPLLEFSGEEVQAATLSGFSLIGGENLTDGLMAYVPADGSVTVADVVVSDFPESGMLLWAGLVESIQISDTSFLRNGQSGGQSGLMIVSEGSTAAITVENTVFEGNGQGMYTDLALFGDEVKPTVIRNSVFRDNGSLENLPQTGALRLSYVMNPADWGEPFYRVEDTLFEDNRGSEAGAVSLAGYMVNGGTDSNSDGLVISGSTFRDNQIPDNEWGQGASDVRLPSVWSNEGDGETPPAWTVLRAENSTFASAGLYPSIASESGGARIELNQVTMGGGGLIIGDMAEATTVALHNSVFDTGDQPAVRFGYPPESNGNEELFTTELSGTVASNPGDYLSGEGLTVGTEAEIALGALADNGGTLPTMLPQAGSILVDAGAEVAAGLDTDQRGVARPTGPAADVGAVEVRQGVVTVGDDVRVPEGTDAVFTVSLAGASDWPVSVQPATRDGSAIAGTDYVELAHDGLTWAPGETDVKSVTVTTLADDAVRAEREFGFELSNVSGATLGTRHTATGTITDTSVPTKPKPPVTVPPTPEPPTPGPETPEPPVTAPPAGTDSSGALATTGAPGTPLVWGLGAALLAAAAAVGALQRIRRRGERSAPAGNRG